jgi:Flp pilus assembly protein TadB
MFAQSDFRTRYHIEMERRESDYLRRAIEKNPGTYFRRLHTLAWLSAICASVSAILFASDLYLLAIAHISYLGKRAQAILLLLAFALGACANFLWLRFYRRCIKQAAARSSI